MEPKLQERNWMKPQSVWTTHQKVYQHCTHHVFTKANNPLLVSFCFDMHCRLLMMVAISTPSSLQSLSLCKCICSSGQQCVIPFLITSTPLSPPPSFSQLELYPLDCIMQAGSLSSVVLITCGLFIWQRSSVIILLSIICVLVVHFRSINHMCYCYTLSSKMLADDCPSPQLFPRLSQEPKPPSPALIHIDITSMDKEREHLALGMQQMLEELARNAKQQEEILSQGPVRARQLQEQLLLQQQEQLQGMRLGGVGGRPQSGTGSMAQAIADKSRNGYSNASFQAEQLRAQVRKQRETGGREGGQNLRGDVVLKHAFQHF